MWGLLGSPQLAVKVWPSLGLFKQTFEGTNNTPFSYVLYKNGFDPLWLYRNIGQFH